MAASLNKISEEFQNIRKREFMLEEVLRAYNEAIFDTDRERALKVVREAVERGASPQAVVFEVIIPAIEQNIKSLGECGEMNLAQSFMASQISADLTEEMVKKFPVPPVAVGRMVIGTSAGDLHGLGKRIVIGCLKACMIDVIDLGNNVPAERFVDEAVAKGAQVIGISSMMVHTATGENGCRKVRQLLKERGVEARIKIVVGGAPYRFDPGLYRVVGADGWAPDGNSAGKVVTHLIRGGRI